MCLAVPLLVGDGTHQWVSTPEGVAILSQTCDLVRDDPPTVVVAPVVRLTPAQSAGARDGRRSAVVPLRALGDGCYVDMRQAYSVTKEHLISLARTRGVLSDADVSEFGRLLGRRYSRFPFPDELVYWLRPLQKVAESKHSKPESAEGRAFRHVLDLRLENGAPWERPPLALTLAVIVESGVVPVFPGDDLPDIPGDLAAWLRPKGQLQSADAIAKRLDAAVDPVERHWLWQAIGEAWASKCRPSDSDLKDLDESDRQRINGIVLNQEIASDVTSEDEYSLFRYRRSEALDLDYLSPSVPLFGSPVDLAARQSACRVDVDVHRSSFRRVSAALGAMLRFLRRDKPAGS